MPCPGGSRSSSAAKPKSLPCTSHHTIPCRVLPKPGKDYRKQLADLLLANGRRGDAVVLFMQFVGTPADQVNGMRISPVWPMFEAVAPTLAYDAAAWAATAPRRLNVQPRCLFLCSSLDGGANLAFMPFMHDTAATLAKVIPHAQQRTLEGQTHDVNLEVLAPVLEEFLSK